jgi:transcriptional regulator with XRE-family HTH domain
VRLKPEIAFGQALRHFRKRINFSQEKLSQESGLDRSYISLLERGLRQPSLTSILQLSKALKISSVVFISEVETLLSEDRED